MNSFRFFELKRKSKHSYQFDDFFELHSRAAKGEKDKEVVKMSGFLANLKKFK